MKYKNFKVAQNQIRRQSDSSIKTIYDAVIEIVTNSIDAYYSLNKKYGLIEIVYDKKKRKITFRDNASGMTHTKLIKSFESLGEYSAVNSDSRGMHSRGAKDCKSIGVVEVHTFKDGRYSQVECHDDPDKGLGYEDNDHDATPEIREKYGIKNSGTCVIITNTEENKERYQFPAFEGFVSKLQNSFELFGCINDDARSKGSEIICINAHDGSKQQLKYKAPSDSTVVKDEEFEIEGYPYKSRFILKKAKNTTQRKIIIMSNERSAHEESFIDRSLISNSYLDNYYGELVCSGINELQRQIIINPRSDPKKNPREVIDQARRGGLDRTHPFAEKLLSQPVKILREIIKAEEDKQRAKGTKTTQQLKSLEKEASKLLTDILKDRGDGPGPEPENFRGIKFFPDTAKSLLTNKVHNFTIWISEDHIDNKDNAQLSVDKNLLESYLDIDEVIALTPHSDYQNVYVGQFSIETHDEEAEGEIVFNEDGIRKTRLITKISDIIKREFKSDLEFERDSYTIYDKINKKIKLYARSPEFIKKRTKIKISLENDNVKLLSDEIYLTLKPRSNYASAEIELKSMHVNNNTILTTEVNSKKTSCYLSTKEKEDSGPKIEWVDETLGGERFEWDEDFKLLKLSKPFILARKLYNPNSDAQDLAWFVMYCDLLSDAFTEKLIDYDSKLKPETFDITSEYEVYSIMSDTVNIYSRYRKKIHQKLIKKYIP